MALATALKFSTHNDSIIGFEDFGIFEQKPNFADHALVFMAKGIRKAWKQLIPIIFTENTVKMLTLKSVLIDIIRRLRAIGLLLEVVVTICDQWNTNQSCINSLIIIDTKEVFLKSNIENRYSGYLIDNCEVIHVYDPPHLLKGRCNNLLTKDLHFIEQGTDNVASWKHLLQFYSLGDCEGDLRMCLKLNCVSC